MADIDLKVSPSLHPDNVKQVDGYSERTKGVLGATETAFSAAYQAVGAVHKAKAASAKNQAWTPEQRLLQLDDFANKQFGKVAKQMDAAHDRLVSGIAHLEAQLTEPLQSKAGHAISKEIRGHVKTLSTEKRMEFLTEALSNEDYDSLTAVLGAPSYLSGLDAKMADAFTRQYREQASPEAAERLKAMTGARDLIRNNGGFLHGELRKAVGADHATAQKLRDANSEAEKALILKDAA